MRESTPALSVCLARVLALADQMIDLAQDGAEAGEGVACGVIFGTLRDTGYKLRAAAAAELEKIGRGAVSVPTAVPSRAARRDGAFAMMEERAKMTEAKKKVLIVDDEPDVVTYLEAWFRDHGFETSTATDGEQAIEALAVDRPSLITLDMSMPVQSGVKTYRVIKESPDLKDIPVIIITAIGQPMKTFLHKTKQVPEPEGFIAKPIELQELAALVKQFTA